MTATPTPDARALARRDSMTVIPVSSCLPFAAPDIGISGGCQCSGYGPILPVLAASGNGSALCGYTAVTTVATSTNSFPYV